MKKTLTWALAMALLIAALVSLAGCQRKVTVTTGEIVICTAGEIIEDNTEQIEVPESDVDKYGVTTRVITCETHGNLAALYKEAQDAIAVGDLATARARLATIAASNPTYRKTQEQLAAIDAGTTPAADTADDTTDDTADAADPEDTTTPGDTETDEPVVGPVATLTTYVPDTIEGYVAQGILADLASLSRQYLPTSDAADQLVIEVEQRVNAAAAEAAQQSIVDAYPDAQTQQTIAGHTVLAGSYGQFAAAVFTDGALTVTVELHATGSSGASLIDATFAVVESITK